MKLKNIFELKAANDNNLYTRIVQVNGGRSPQYTKSNYEEICSQGYKGNYVISACLTEIINAATQLEWRVMKKNSQGKPEEIKNHPVVKVIENPNPTMSQSEFIKRSILYYYIGGDTPLVKVIAGGRAKEIYAHNPQKMSFSLTGDLEKPYDDIRYNGETVRDIEPERFTLWKCFDPQDRFDGLGRGMSPLSSILKNGDLLNEMINWNFALLMNGGSLSGVIATEGLTGEEYERAEKQLSNKHTGSSNVGKFLLLEGNAKYYSSGVSPKDLEWKEGKNSVAVDIMMALRVDPLILGLNEHSSYNNKNEAYKALYTNNVIPLMRSFADVLGPFLGVQDGEYLDIDYSNIPCLQEDMNELNDRLNKADDLSMNEKRAIRGMEPMSVDITKYGDCVIIGDKVYMPMNLVNEADNEPPKTENLQDENSKSLY